MTIRYYVGNCVDGLEDEWFQNNVAADATELAQLVDESNSKPLTLDDFLATCEVSEEWENQLRQNSERYELASNEDKKVSWIYNREIDIHHFFAEV